MTNCCYTMTVMILTNITCVKEARYKRIHTVWFYLNKAPKEKKLMYVLYL